VSQTRLQSWIKRWQTCPAITFTRRTTSCSKPSGAAYPARMMRRSWQNSNSSNGISSRGAKQS